VSTLSLKLWWTFGIKKSMWNKYCKRLRPQVVEGKGGSQLWKYMLEARESFNQLIWWEPKCGNSNVWYDN